MAHKLINRKFYDSILHFDESEDAQNDYYRVMSTETGRVNKDGSEETIRDQILRVYGALFCEDRGLRDGEPAGVEDVASTADRLHIGSMAFDSRHWYRMQYHFPVIDEDNYERFAALVIADMNAGPLREAAINGGDTLLVGEADPLSMTREERMTQRVRSVSL